jgi:hypothetical protein
MLISLFTSIIDVLEEIRGEFLRTVGNIVSIGNIYVKKAPKRERLHYPRFFDSVDVSD